MNGNTGQVETVDREVEFEFDAFLSYSTDPDYRLVRRVESFLESFHKQFREADVERFGIKQLRVCVDGSDFRPVASSAPNPIKREIEARLSVSRWLIVFCSHNSMMSKWVDQEVAWFLKNRGRDFIKLVVTEGEDPSAAPEDFFSKQIVRERCHVAPWLDLRAAVRKVKPSQRKVRDAREALVQLAAGLQVPPRTAGEILPVWQQEEKRRSRRRMIAMSGGVAVSLLAAAGAMKIWADRPERLVDSARQRLQNSGFDTVSSDAEDPESRWRVVANHEIIPMHSPPPEWDALESCFAVLQRYQGVESVDVKFTQLRHLDPLSPLDGLTHLDVAACNLESLDALSDMRLLKVLNLSLNPNLTDSALAPLTLLSELTAIDFTDCREISSRGLRCLASLVALRDVLLNSCELINNAILTHLRTRELRQFSTKGTGIRIDNRYVDFVESQSKIKLVSVDPDDADPAAHDDLRRLRDQRGFTLDDQPIQEGGF